tara:strand:- start:51134 stop:52330 length:1197 start_codon:yes stop_codon:yes gene_type:complete
MLFYPTNVSADSSRSPIDRPTIGTADAARSVAVVDFDGLSELDKQVWETIRATRPEFRSPFFSVGFSAAVHRARGDVDVAILREGSDPIGYFPFHRIRNVALPVGRFFNDAHNIITRREHLIDWMWFLKQCDLKAFDFHAMPGTSQAVLDEHSHGTIDSFAADIGDDSIAYLNRLRKSHRTIARQPQKTRKMQREIGPVRLEFDCRDPELLDLTIGWKRQQYRRTHILDLFGPNWTRRLVTELHRADDESQHDETTHDDRDDTTMRGLLSVLWAGDQVVAAHFGIREGDLIHYWFPAFNAKYARYSPGTALYCAMIESATEKGVRCIDMGYGEQPYKLKQTDAVTSVAFGCLSRSRLHGWWRSAETKAISMVKRMPMKEPIKRVWRRVQPQAGISKIR